MSSLFSIARIGAAVVVVGLVTGCTTAQIQAIDTAVTNAVTAACAKYEQDKPKIDNALLVAQTVLSVDTVLVNPTSGVSSTVGDIVSGVVSAEDDYIDPLCADPSQWQSTSDQIVLNYLNSALQQSQALQTKAEQTDPATAKIVEQDTSTLP